MFLVFGQNFRNPAGCGFELRGATVHKLLQCLLSSRLLKHPDVGDVISICAVLALETSRDSHVFFFFKGSNYWCHWRDFGKIGSWAQHGKHMKNPLKKTTCMEFNILNTQTQNNIFFRVIKTTLHQNMFRKIKTPNGVADSAHRKPLT